MTFNWTCDCVGPQENGKCPCENEKKKCEGDDATPDKICECINK